MAKYINVDNLGIGKCNPNVFEDKGYAKGWNSAIDIIEKAPAADVRPVVLCRDCIHNKGEKVWELLGDTTADCNCGHGYPPLDWFCADGVKREES